MRLFVLPQTFSPPFPCSAEEPALIKLSGKDRHYITDVLRLKKGQPLTGVDRSGQPWTLKIEDISPECCVLSGYPSENLSQTTDSLPQDRPRKNLILYLCLPKGHKTDEIIRAAAQIGARAVVLVKSANCVADLSGKETSRLSRYEAVIREAVQQSGSAVPTQILGVIDIKEVPAHFKEFSASCGDRGGKGIFFHQRRLAENQTGLVESLKGFEGTAGLLTGPEGGLSEDECNFLLSSGFSPVLLKTNILRCETAAVYALAAAQVIMEET